MGESPIDNKVGISENAFQLKVMTMSRGISWVFKKGSFPLFVMVGGVNTLFGYSVFVLGIHSGLHYTAASLLSLVLGVTFNFFTTGKIVFDRFDTKLIGRFIAIYLFLYLITISLIKVTSFYVDNMYLNGFIVTVLMSVISFLLNKNIVFRK